MYLKDVKNRWDSINYEKKSLEIELLKAKYFLKVAKDLSIQKELELNIKNIKDKIKNLEEEAERITEIAENFENMYMQEVI
ncbi:MAG: hypothetical protein ACTJGH_00290 [Peptoniphilaceae bacterium]